MGKEPNWEQLYVELGALLASMPNEIRTQDSVWVDVNPAVLQWASRVGAAIEAQDDIVESTAARSAIMNLSSAVRASELVTLLNRALARAERRAPVSAQGAFIPVGHAFDAFAAIGKILGVAKAFVLIVDPYMDNKALDEFGTLVPAGVALQLLADAKDHKASLPPAVARWKTQHASARPLEVRLSPKGALHDRLIMVDSAGVWALTQSLNAFAARSPATILKADPETAALKVQAYAALWAAATPI